MTVRKRDYVVTVDSLWINTIQRDRVGDRERESVRDDDRAYYKCCMQD